MIDIKYTIGVNEDDDPSVDTNIGRRRRISIDMKISINTGNANRHVDINWYENTQSFDTKILVRLIVDENRLDTEILST